MKNRFSLSYLTLSMIIVGIASPTIMGSAIDNMNMANQQQELHRGAALPNSGRQDFMANPKQGQHQFTLTFGDIVSNNAKKVPKEQKPFPCGVQDCKSGYARKSDLQGHMRLKHPEIACREGLFKGQYLCQLCHNKFPREKEYHKHTCARGIPQNDPGKACEPYDESSSDDDSEDMFNQIPMVHRIPEIPGTGVFKWDNGDGTEGAEPMDDEEIEHTQRKNTSNENPLKSSLPYLLN